MCSKTLEFEKSTSTNSADQSEDWQSLLELLLQALQADANSFGEIARAHRSEVLTTLTILWQEIIDSSHIARSPTCDTYPSTESLPVATL